LFELKVKIANLAQPNCVQVIKFLSFILLLSIIQGSFAQGTATPQYRYLILFKDKQSTNYSINNPEAFLSQRAIARRQKMQIKINEQDLPIPTNKSRCSDTLPAQMDKWGRHQDRVEQIEKSLRIAIS
jgi:hypothetical protein